MKMTDRRITLLFTCITGLTILILVFIIGFIMVKGLPGLTLSFLLESPKEMGRTGGIFPAIVGTVLLTGMAVVIAAPVGVLTAVYLTEYTRDTWLPKIVRFGTESLAGIPSIIFGLFGFLFFVIYMDLGWSVLSGALTLSAMILPTIVRTSEEAIRAVPDAYREVSFALGSTRWQTVTSVVLPSAKPGIMTGVMLAVGRAIGETAAVIFTAGSSLRLPGTLLDSTRTLPVHFYILAREGISLENAYSTALVLILLILVINITAYAVMNRLANKGR
jgi:phosphate transport system permease protein